MTPYEKLRQLRNDILHGRKPPLEFGCEVKLKSYSYRIFTCIGYSDGYAIFQDEKGDRERSTLTVSEKNAMVKKILGPPVTLAEILVMMQKQCDIEEFAVSSDGSFSWDKIDFGMREHRGMSYAVDLANPPSEWPDDTLKKIIELL